MSHDTIRKLRDALADVLDTFHQGRMVAAPRSAGYVNANIKRAEAAIAAADAALAVPEPEPYAWFWRDGSDGGVVTLRQDYEHHEATYPRMTFTAVYTRSAPPQPEPGGREGE